MQCNPVQKSNSDYLDMHLKRHLCANITQFYMKLLRQGPMQFRDLVEIRSWKFEASKMLEHRKGISCAGHWKCWSNNDTIAQGSSVLCFVLFCFHPQLMKTTPLNEDTEQNSIQTFFRHSCKLLERCACW